MKIIVGVADICYKILGMELDIVLMCTGQQKEHILNLKMDYKGSNLLFTMGRV